MPLGIKKRLMTALRGEQSLIAGRMERGLVCWNSVPAPNVSPWQHNFSLLDAIETASAFLETDYASQKEWVVMGTKARSIITTLPHFQHADVNGYYCGERWEECTRMGKLGARVYYYRPGPATANQLIVFNDAQRVVRVVFSVGE